MTAPDALIGLSDDEISKLNVKFQQLDVAPPDRTISAVKNFLENEFDWSHTSSCDGSNFYEVYPPTRSSRINYEANANSWLEAAITALKYGDFEQAMRYISNAINAYPVDWAMEPARMMYSRSIFLAAVGDTARSKREFNQATALLRKGKMWSPEVYERWRSQYETPQGVARAVNIYNKGFYRDAELLLRDSRYATGSAINYKTIEYFLILSIANQGRYDQAEAMARNAVNGSWDVIDLLWSVDSLAYVLSLQGRYDDAEWLARQAVDFFALNCAPLTYFTVSRAYLRLAQILTAQGEWSGALKIFSEIARNEIRVKSGIVENLLYGNPDWGIALMEAGRSNDAVSILNKSRAFITARYGPDAYETLEVDLFQRISELNDDRDLVAFRRVEAALLTLIQKRVFGSISAEKQHQQNRRRALAIDQYLSIASSGLGGEETVERSFVIAQSAYSGTIQTSLASGMARLTVADPMLKDLIGQNQDISNRIKELNRILVYQTSLEPGEKKITSIAVLESELRKLQDENRLIWDKITASFPAYAQMISPAPMTKSKLVDLMHVNEATLLVRVTKAGTYTWAVNADGDISFNRADLNEEEIDRLVADLRQSLAPEAIETLSDIPNFDVVLAHRIYKALLAPLASVWEGADTLIVVSDGALQQIPFSLLPMTSKRLEPSHESLMFSEYRSVSWLANQYAITVLPTIGSLRLIRGRAAIPGTQPFVGFGDPIFNAKQAERDLNSNGHRGAKPTLLTAGNRREVPITVRSSTNTTTMQSASIGNLPRLPETADELRGIARALGANENTDIYIGLNADEGLIKRLDLSPYRVIAFATHGLATGDLNGLFQPALALSSPEVTSSEEDGLLTMGEIMNLRLNANWVVLSACNTAASDGRGAEVISGLGQAFFYAGTRALLLSNWPVHSVSTMELTNQLFTEMAGTPSLSRSEAMRKARRYLITSAGWYNQQGEMLFSYAHPIFWAPFTVVGDGGRSLN